MLTSTYETLWFSIIILSIKSVNEILFFGHYECFLPDTLSVTHYSKLTVQYQKNVNNTVASSAVNVTLHFRNTNDDNSLSDILARWGLMKRPPWLNTRSTAACDNLKAVVRMNGGHIEQLF